jgi:hypothetical protein
MAPRREEVPRAIDARADAVLVRRGAKDALEYPDEMKFPGLPALGLPPVVPSAGPGLPAESLTATQKAQIVAYLNAI